jgi:colicin import membrane protein
MLMLCAALLTLACGGSKPAGPSADQKAADAAAAAKVKAAEDEVAVAARKAKREADEKAKADAQAKLAAEFERLCVLPDKLPRDPVAACEAVGKAHDAFIRRVSDPAAVTAWEAGGSEKAIPMTVVRCTQSDSIKAAACQKNALDGAGPELKDEVGKLMQLCIDKFAAKGQPPAGMPQRRPG